MRVLLFHNVIRDALDEIDRGCERLHVNRFTRNVEALRSKYEVVRFEPGMWSQPARTTKPPLLLTFDDGFAGVCEEALPVLQRLDMTGVVFVLTQDGAPIPPDRLLHFERLEIAIRLTTAADLDLRADDVGLCALGSISERMRALKTVKQWLKRLPHAAWQPAFDRVIDALGVDAPRMAAFAASSPGRYRKLSSAEIATLIAQGWTIGGHTRTHPSLAYLEAGTLRDEVMGNANDLRPLGLTQIPFAYPYGGPDHISAAAEAAVRDAGFCCAFTTIQGDNDADTNPFLLRRFDVAALQQLELGLGRAWPR